MTGQKAIKIKAPKEAEVVTDAAKPKLRDDYIIVKTAAVALNPVDWKHIDYFPSPGAIVGCDYAGVVEQVGSSVKNDLKPGDRVAGMVHGSNHVHHEDGAFAEYITAKGDIQMKIPNSWSFEDAATLGVGINTVGQGLYQALGLPLPTEPTKEPFPVLIYGGSTATGTLAIQFAKLSGLQVITTCSPRNFQLVRDAGADYVYDYNSPDCASEIRGITQNKLLHVFDTVATESTAKVIAEAMGTSGGKYASVGPISHIPRDDVILDVRVALSAMGEAFLLGDTAIPAKPEDLVFATKWARIVEGLLREGKIKAHPSDLRHGGLDKVLDGLKEMREGKISGSKLVYQVKLCTSLP